MQVALTWHIVPLQVFTKFQNENKFEINVMKIFSLSYQVYLLVQLIPSPSKPVSHSQCIPFSVELRQVALMWHIVPLQVLAKIYKYENKVKINWEKMFSLSYQMYLLVQLIPSSSEPIMHSQY